MIQTFCFVPSFLGFSDNLFVPSHFTRLNVCAYREHCYYPSEKVRTTSNDEKKATLFETKPLEIREQNHIAVVAGGCSALKSITN